MAARKAAGFDDVVTQLKLTNRLLAAPLKQSLGQQGLIKLLMSTGASPHEIADVLDTTPATVKTTVGRLKGKNK